MTWYTFLKVVHVLAAVAWIGGGVAFAVVTARLLRAGDRPTLNALQPQVTRYMQTAGGLGAPLVLLTGIAMVIVGKIDFGTLWVGLGFGGIIVHGLYAAFVTVMRKRMIALMHATPAAPGSDLAQAGARLRTANVVYLAIMVVVVAVMVLKPTL